ncbi:tetratricopeptide repeat protein [Myxococcota bacterium]|nr:tetratricopeptide repeat protein [Myxococcota bacterium]MBU1382910.1 tetratricopeptide repeat protein [Myxococcota bacterium]MBU1495384.1 tetratricopeptide repeat protein [Myxococcota bacterium]
MITGIVAGFLILFSGQNPEFQVKLAKAQLLQKAGNCGQAMPVFEELLKIDSSNSEVHYYKALCHIQTEQWTKAEDELLEVYEDFSNNFSYLTVLGEVRLKLAKYTWAMKHFKAALDIRKDDVKVRYFLAFSLFHLKDCNSVRSVLDYDGNWGTYKAKTVILLSLCSVREKKLTQARNLLWRYRSFGGDVTSLLDMVFVQELGLKRTMGGYWRINQGFDTNPTVDPDLQVKSDGGFFTQARGNLYLNFPKFESSFTVERNWYWSQTGVEEYKRVNSFSSWNLSGDARFVHRYLDNGNHSAFSAGYQFRLIRIDGGEGIPLEPQAFMYAETHGLSLTYRQSYGKNYTVETSFQPSYTVMRDSDRTGLSLTQNLTQAIFFRNGKVKWFPSLSATLTDASWDAWKSVSVSFWNGISMVLPWKSDLAFWGSAQWRHFPYSADEMPDNANPWQLPFDTNRTDWMLSTGITIGRKIKTTFNPRLELTFSHSWNNSNSPVYDYNRTAVYLSVSGEFGILQ